MAKLGKIATKKIYQTSDGKKFETFEEAQYHSRVLLFREQINLNYEKE